jgi:hypothetical protein
MKINWSEVKIFIKPGVTDFRKQINGLASQVEEEFGEGVFSGNLYLFCNRTRKRMKILYWDRSGLKMIDFHGRELMQSALRLHQMNSACCLTA